MLVDHFFKSATKVLYKSVYLDTISHQTPLLCLQLKSVEGEKKTRCWHYFLVLMQNKKIKKSRHIAWKCLMKKTDKAEILLKNKMKEISLWP